MSNSYPRGTVEYVTATVSADVELDEQAVVLSISRGNVHTWLPAQWVGGVATTRQCRTADPIAFDDDYTATSYSVFVKLTDNPEAPIMSAGSLTIS